MRRLLATLRAIAMAVLKRPEGLLLVTFALLIVVGSILLALPVAHHAGKVGPLDALFTATSAVCVTGLVVVETGADYTRFGQIVVLVLIQLGGLGIMTFAALGAQMLRRRLSFRSQAVLADVFYQREAAGVLKQNLKRIILLTFVLESIGAWLLYLHFRHDAAGQPPLYSAVFHSISAFCTAGFSLHSDSLTAYRSDLLVVGTIMVLIILGGLGHTVVLESLQRAGRALLRRPNRPVQWSLHSRVVLTSSAVLIAVGTVGLLAFGLGEDGQGWAQRVLNALFQSVTARTAGFNTIAIGALPMASLLILVALMFVGGSPGSCAGGIKTTSVAVWIAYFRAQIRSTQDATLYGRRLPQGLIARAAVIGGLAIVWNAAGCLILSATESASSGASLDRLLFEQISAFGTVGLSTGITASLSTVGKLWIIATMFVGRLGPLSVALAVMTQRPSTVRYPEEHLMIG
jgi:trk system potassium uptake protein TrkH